MRLRGIKNITEANKYLEEFREDYNQKFSKKAACDVDAHRRALPSDSVLNSILCERHYRKLSDNLEFHFECKVYQIVNYGKCNLKRVSVTVCCYANDEIKVWYGNMFLECKEFKQKQLAIVTSSRQETNIVVDDLCAQVANKLGAEQSWMNVPFLRLMSCNRNT